MHSLYVWDRCHWNVCFSWCLICWCMPPWTSHLNVSCATISDNILRPESATSSTSSVVTAENSGTRALGGVQDDFKLCTEFVQKTCGYTKANSKLFSIDHYFEHRFQASLLTQQELDLILLGSIMTTVLDHDSIVDGRHKPAKWSKISSCHIHNGYKVYKSMYAGVGTKHRLENIKKH